MVITALTGDSAATGGSFEATLTTVRELSGPNCDRREIRDGSTVAAERSAGSWLLFLSTDGPAQNHGVGISLGRGSVCNALEE